MDLIMLQTINESINGGRTVQAFVKGASYPVPDDIGQLWVGRGWAVAARAPKAATPYADRNGSRT